MELIVNRMCFARIEYLQPIICTAKSSAYIKHFTWSLLIEDKSLLYLINMVGPKIEPFVVHQSEQGNNYKTTMSINRLVSI